MDIQFNNISGDGNIGGPGMIVNANHYSSVDSGPCAGLAPGPLDVAINTIPSIPGKSLYTDTTGRADTPYLLDVESQAQRVPKNPTVDRRGN